MKILGAEWVAAAAGSAQFPGGDTPEVAFLGRSNVGKSSLLNRLAQRRKLARTSGTPGKTRLVHWYRITRPQGEILFVDLPGYGYARVSRAQRGRWRGLVESYLEGRGALRCAVLLQDLRRDFSEDEDLLISWLREREIPVVLALTKVDKLKQMRRGQRIAELRRDTDLRDDCIVATSAEKSLGIDLLWSAIDARL
ncbi:MAG: ribosome biogenesis GTP-binding protein YihA/YsxC [Myxococcota bacterium]